MTKSEESRINLEKSRLEKFHLFDAERGGGDKIFSRGRKIRDTWRLETERRRELSKIDSINLLEFRVGGIICGIGVSWM